MAPNLLSRLPRLNLARGYCHRVAAGNTLRSLTLLGPKHVVVSTSSIISRRFYGHDDIAHYRHLSFLRELGLTDNAQPDSFYDQQQITEACNNAKLYNLSRVIADGIKAAQNLKRYKLAISFIEFALATDNFDKKRVVMYAETIMLAFANGVIDVSKRDALIDKLRPFPPVLASQIEALVSDDPSLAGSNACVKSTANAAHFLRTRDLDSLTKLYENDLSVNLLDDVTRGPLLEWYESDKQAAPKLFELMMEYYTKNQLILMDDTDFLHLPAFKQFPDFLKVKVTPQHPKCPHCEEPFQPKPKFTPAEWSVQREHLINHARTNTKNPYNPVMIKNAITFGEKLIKARGSNPLPIVLVDVANVAYKKTHLGNIHMISYFLQQLYTEFSIVGLFCKFEIPKDLAQFKKVHRFHSLTKADDDLDLLLVLSVCGSDTYIVSNDFHRPYFNDARAHNMVQSRKLFFNAQTRKVELPNELSPYVQRTPTGFHIPVKSQKPTAYPYKFYCTAGLI
uniref:Ribonuclease P n=1 Tax=Panagrellus redivivus TaxID=6233 RepID=A0A7E5A0V1_PANRE